MNPFIRSEENTNIKVEDKIDHQNIKQELNDRIKIQARKKGGTCSIYLSAEAQEVLEHYSESTLIPKSKIVDALILEYLKS